MNNLDFIVNNTFMKQQKVIYYTDELNDEFSGISRKTITVDENYRYSHNRLWRAASWILYRIVMTPVAYVYMKLVFGMKIVGKYKLARHAGEGFFLYGNHTLIPGDGYMPTCITFPKRDIVVVHPDNVSLFGTRNFMEMIGALPLPNRQGGMEPFLGAMRRELEKGRCIVIYPEAHIWPYYTKIRPFTYVAFRYPAMYDKPAYSFTATYRRGRGGRARIVVYIDGPFYADRGMQAREAAGKLRDEIYGVMSERSRNSTFEKIRYIKKEL